MKIPPGYRYVLPRSERARIYVHRKVVNALRVYARHKGVTLAEAAFLIITKGFSVAFREDPRHEFFRPIHLLMCDAYEKATGQKLPDHIRNKTWFGFLEK